MNNFCFLVLDYVESWLNLVIVSVFVLKSKQVGTFKIVNSKHSDWASMQGSALSVLNSLSNGVKYFKIWLKT